MHVDDIDWQSWSPSERAVLCFVRDNDRILLIHKKTGLGKGKINGPGGRIEQGELPVAAAVRETQEEVGITPEDPVERGTLSFIFTNGYSLHCRVFFASVWHGELTETYEAKPFWCRINDIPYDRMWADDELWLPRALEGREFDGYFTFDEDSMLSHRMMERESA